MIDWKSVAQRRLRELRNMEAWRLNMRAEIYAELRRNVGMALHARCVGNSNEIAEEIAHDVSIRMTTS